ncbi:suppressor of mutant AC40 of RNA polymerase i and iii [Fusarium subglutinans]|uniref:Suppressor of mutant AC40 of RNA polymerase i and iii n=1 Tax=Gibberella subglutinans TaxID=42677 RepID=A0A8H5PG25_GIBSU|nr:suppressor of mutant AC40 of RNA polymerase i and iii [Fusarium subglutinans]KAF5596127.1 suppressor of mutant AC40 of RNA polymerase i and iii [Fusarium subglutinans]
MPNKKPSPKGKGKGKAKAAPRPRNPEPTPPPPPPPLLLLLLLLLLLNQRLSGTANIANTERRIKLKLNYAARPSAAGPSNQGQPSGSNTAATSSSSSSATTSAAAIATPSPSPSPSTSSSSSSSSSSGRSAPTDQNESAAPRRGVIKVNTRNGAAYREAHASSSPAAGPSGQGRHLGTGSSSSSELSSLPFTSPSPPPPFPSDQDEHSSSSSSSASSSPSSSPSAETVAPGTPMPSAAGPSNDIPSSSTGSGSNSDTESSSSSSPARTSPPPNHPSPDTIKVDVFIATGHEQPSSDEYESDGDGCSGDPPRDGSEDESSGSGGSSGYEPSEETDDDTVFTGSESSSDSEEDDGNDDDASGGPCSGPSSSSGPPGPPGPSDPPGSSGVLITDGSPSTQEYPSGYEGDDEYNSGPAADGSSIVRDDTGAWAMVSNTSGSRNRSTCLAGFDSPRLDGRSRRPSRPADIEVPFIDYSGYDAQVGCEEEDSPDCAEFIGPLRSSFPTSVQPIGRLDTPPAHPGGAVGKRKRSCDYDEDASAAGIKRVRSLSPRMVVETSTATVTTTRSASEPWQPMAWTSNSPVSDEPSPLSNEPVAYAMIATPVDDLTSGELSPPIWPSFDPEIPGMHGSGLRARRHYDWYEQLHSVGHECYKVHPCTHNMGRGCHECHSDWQEDWARFFKAEELLHEAAADPERYLRETGLDMREDFMGALLQGASWEVVAPHLLPPAGGRLRVHPMRLAKHRLILAQSAAQV